MLGQPYRPTTRYSADNQESRGFEYAKRLYQTVPAPNIQIKLNQLNVNQMLFWQHQSSIGSMYFVCLGAGCTKGPYPSIKEIHSVFGWGGVIHKLKYNLSYLQTIIICDMFFLQLYNQFPKQSNTLPNVIFMDKNDNFRIVITLVEEGKMYEKNETYFIDNGTLKKHNNSNHFPTNSHYELNFCITENFNSNIEHLQISVELTNATLIDISTARHWHAVNRSVEYVVS